ncbi:hypothetical protein EYE40_14290 [Glaciihabitans arcticus]|uniref:Alpha-amylase n=1 Tax=Glaciihabitans arcticus TaxID=2668039 RepID=A0A4Q9GLS9_9MICO|nr:hypothetical protein [Glaciihabitans arcticus]TBN55379.1 hypothetical protein EYE40_14290 [Glaciihabitans arcticus]
MGDTLTVRRTWALGVSAVLTAVLLLTGITPAASADTVSLTVTVLTPAKVPVSTAKVTAIPLDDANYGDTQPEIVGLFTSAGRYVFGNTLDGSVPYAIRVDTNKNVSNSNFTQYWGGGSDLAGAKPWTSAEGLALEVKLLGGTYSGKVLTSKGGGLPNVDVHLFKWDGVRWSLVKTVVSAAKTGVYSFPYLEPGSYTTEFDTSRVQRSYISVFAGGAAVYGTETVPQSIGTGRVSYVNFGTPAVVNQKLAIGGTLSGQLISGTATNKVPVDLVPVAIRGTAPNQTGSALPRQPLKVSTPAAFTLTGLPTGFYSLSAASGSVSGSYIDPGTPSSQKVYFVKAGAVTKAGIVDVAATGPAGLLQGSFSSDAVTGGTIDIARADDVAVSSTSILISSNGTFERQLRPGLYTYEARPVGATPLKAVYGSVTVGFGGAVELLLPAEEEAPMAFDPPPSVAPSGGTVGTTFTASATSNHPTTSVVTYQWLRDGIPIFGARSAGYTAGGGDEDRQLKVRIGITDLESNDHVSTTLTVATVAAGEPLSVDTPPSIIAPATVKVGTVLRANPGTWSETPVTLSYQWMLNGGIIPGATKPTFSPVAAQGGQDIGLSVTATRAGYPSATYTPAYTGNFYVSVAPLPAPALKTAPVITVTTKGLAGKVRYTASPGTWSPTPLYVTYDWYLDGDLQDSSPSRTLTLDPVFDDMTAVLTVDVRAARVGGLSGSTLLVARKSSLPPIADALPAVVRTLGEDPLAADAPVRSGESLIVAPGYWIYADPRYVREVGRLTHTYAWYRGTAPRVKIAGATKSTYRVTDADNGLPISVTVVTSSPGMVPAATILPAGVGYLDDSLGEVDATVTFDAPAFPLAPVTATVSPSFSAFAPVTTGYQWMTCRPTSSECGTASDFTPIAKATGRTYTPPVALADSRLGVRVSVGKVGFRAVSFFASEAVGAAGTITAGLPGLTRSPIVGAAVGAVAGSKNITGTTSTFLWQTSSDGATWVTAGSGATLVPDAALFGARLRVIETVKKAGYGTLELESAPVEIGAGGEFATSAPKITTVGLTSTIVGPTFAPAGAPSYQWFVGGEPAGNGPSYERVEADAAKPLTVTISFESGQAAYAADTFVQTLVAVRGVRPVQPAPAIIGSRLGEVLGAPVIDYPSTAMNEKITYQWYLAGTAIKGATRPTFTPSTSNVGKKLTVRVVSTSLNYATVSVLSRPLTLLAGVNPTGAPTVDVTGGVLKPGVVVTATTSSFTLAGQTFAYQWQVNTGAGWASIAKATAKTYRVLPTQVGASIRVIVTGKRAGYASLTGASVAGVVLTSGELPLLTAPALVGTGIAGSALSVSAPTFGASGVILSYRWLRNGVVMPGAAGASFVTSIGQIKDSITVEVTAKAPGYLTWVSLLDARVITG